MNKHTFEYYSDAGEAIFSSDAAVSLLADGFRFLEGPAWHPVEQHLTFSDIMGNALYRRFEEGRIEMIRPNSYLANGNSYDREGRLVTCEHGTSRVTRTEHDGSVTILASHYRGKELNSPNDIVVKSDGSIYFTDPNPGRSPRVGIPRKQELDFQGVYRIDGNSGELIRLADDFSKPNGLCFSPDESLLYVNDTDHQHIRVFNVKDDGTLEKGRLFAELLRDGPGVADGMKFDSARNLFCSAPGGIQIFNEEGTLTARLFTPEVAANFTWGGKELKTLFLTATTGLYSMPVRIPGLPLF